jgi:MOSC domain-containing protein YiiM
VADVPAGRVLSVNVGQAVDVPYRGQMVATGIFKGPLEGPVELRAEGLEGDVQADRRVHGGVDKAVYLYGWDAYLWWMEELGHRLQPGEFGENLTIGVLDERRLHVGDRFRVGGALVELTTPREPCFKLGIRMGDPGFLKRFARAGRTGVYARVLEEGPVAAGDAIERVEEAADQPTIAELHRLFAFARDDVVALRRAIAAPALPEGWRRMYERAAEQAAAATP